MPEPKIDALVKALESLVSEKQAVTSKEKELVDGLNAVIFPHFLFTKTTTIKSVA